LEKRHPIANARALRRTSTDAERHLWRFLRNRQLGDYRFRHQVLLGRYVADFVCMEAKVIVELDGGQHAELAMDDGLRTEYLQRGSFASCASGTTMPFSEPTPCSGKSLTP
jgi:very-short-patch-repair endonuclease